MTIEVFTNKTTNFESGLIDFEGGRLQVDVAGVLDGADLRTLYIGANGVETIIRSCSWITSLGDTLVTADAGLELLNKSVLKFSIINAGASTDLSLQYSGVYIPS